MVTKRQKNGDVEFASALLEARNDQTQKKCKTIKMKKASRKASKNLSSIIQKYELATELLSALI